MTGAANERQRGWNDHFDVPVVSHPSLADTRFDGVESAIHQVALENGRTLDAFAQLQPAEELFVSFHGAVKPGPNRYPSFWRVASMKDRVQALLVIADPTLQLSDHEDFRLAWYAGGPEWDPMDDIEIFVRRVQQHVGAKHVCFLGGAGGGFAALRASTRFPGSLAFPQDPQTDIDKYLAVTRDAYYRECWPDQEPADVTKADPERFDVTHLYATRKPKNFVYFRQSLGDLFHMEQHTVPFMKAVGDSPRVHFDLSRGKVWGHGKIQPAEFDAAFEGAVEFWRDIRQRRGVDGPSRVRAIDPAQHTVYSSLAEFVRADEYPPGILTVMDSGVPIDIRHDPRGFDTTTVMFHAALSSKAYRFPVFTGSGITDEMPTNRILLCDPSLYVSDELRLAWFAGNHRQPRLQWTIRTILKALIPATQRVVTFGASGGGFASMYYATKFDDAIAVPMNPQTNIANYATAAVERYTREGWNLEGSDRIAEIPPVTNLLDLYRRPVANRVFYLQNRNDTSHMKGHFEPFMQSLPSNHQVVPVIVDGKSGHVPPSKEQIHEVLAAAIRGDKSPPPPLSRD